MSPVVERARVGYWTCDGEIRHAESFDDGVPDYWEPLDYCTYCGERMPDNEGVLHGYCVRTAQAHVRLDRNYAEYVASQEGQMDRRVRKS
jgi:hypothetical protein